MLIGEAHGAGIRVVAHVEGAGQAERALTAGVDVLAHVPWTERLDESVVAGIAARCEWISTLALHAGAARATALDNARRFVRAGGRLRYGTDMGNGRWPVGIRREEVLALGEAGLAGGELIEALTGYRSGPIDEDRTVVGERPIPADAGGVADWYLAAERVPVRPSASAGSA